jgi:hypothetical protein
VTDPRAGDPLDVQEIADLLPYVNRVPGPPPIGTDGWTAWSMGYTDGERHARRAWRGPSLLAIAVIIAASIAFGLAIGRATAAPRPQALSGAGTSAAGPATGAPHVRDALDPGDGNQEAAPSGTPVARRSRPPAPRPTPGPDANWLVRTGDASTYGDGWDGWLAIPEGPGYLITVCGPSDCAEQLLTNDAGPSLAWQRKGRIVDLDVPTFELVCGVPWRIAGTCPVSVTILRVPHG